IGGFERVLSYGIGLASSQCVGGLELGGPARLVVDVATTASASTTAASTPLLTQRAATHLGQFSRLAHTSGVNSGPAMQLTLLDVQEVEQLGDFEAVLSWGAGLSRASCLRTLELSNPTRLVIDVQTP